MSTDKSEDGTTDIEKVRADIERDREQLVRTVDALGARLDVKSRARHRIQAVRSDATDAIVSARSESVRRIGEVRDAATTDRGRPTQQTIAVAAATALVVAGIVVLAVRRNRHR